MIHYHILFTQTHNAFHWIKNEEKKKDAIKVGFIHFIAKNRDTEKWEKKNQFHKYESHL